MTDVIKIKRDWGKINHAEIAQVLTERFFGLKPNVIDWLRMFAIMLATMVLVDRLLPHQFQPRNWIIGMAPLFFAGLVEMAINRARARRLFHAIAMAPKHRNNRPVFLSEEEISDFGPPRKNELVWEYITDIAPYNNLVLLLLSPVEYIPLQMDGLPDGMTREALLEQIEKWRAGV